MRYNNSKNILGMSTFFCLSSPLWKQVSIFVNYSVLINLYSLGKLLAVVY